MWPDRSSKRRWCDAHPFLHRLRGSAKRSVATARRPSGCLGALRVNGYHCCRTGGYHYSIMGAKRLNKPVRSPAVSRLRASSDFRRSAIFRHSINPYPGATRHGLLKQINPTPEQCRSRRVLTVNVTVHPRKSCLNDLILAKRPQFTGTMAERRFAVSHLPAHTDVVIPARLCRTLRPGAELPGQLRCKGDSPHFRRT